MAPVLYVCCLCESSDENICLSAWLALAPPVLLATEDSARKRQSVLTPVAAGLSLPNFISWSAVLYPYHHGTYLRGTPKDDMIIFLVFRILLLLSSLAASSASPHKSFGVHPGGATATREPTDKHLRVHCRSSPQLLLDNNPAMQMDATRDNSWSLYFRLLHGNASWLRTSSISRMIPAHAWQGRSKCYGTNSRSYLIDKALAVMFQFRPAVTE